MTRSKAGGKLTRVGCNGAGCRRELSILSGREINGESKFSTDGNKAA